MQRADRQAVFMLTNPRVLVLQLGALETRRLAGSASDRTAPTTTKIYQNSRPGLQAVSGLSSGAAMSGELAL